MLGEGLQQMVIADQQTRPQKRLLFSAEAQAAVCDTCLGYGCFARHANGQMEQMPSVEATSNRLRAAAAKDGIIVAGICIPATSVIMECSCCGGLGFHIDLEQPSS